MCDTQESFTSDGHPNYHSGSKKLQWPHLNSKLSRFIGVTDKVSREQRVMQRVMQRSTSSIAYEVILVWSQEGTGTIVDDFADTCWGINIFCANSSIHTMFDTIIKTNLDDYIIRSDVAGCMTPNLKGVFPSNRTWISIRTGYRIRGLWIGGVEWPPEAPAPPGRGPNGRKRRWHSSHWASPQGRTWCECSCASSCSGGSSSRRQLGCGRAAPIDAIKQ